MSLSNRQRKIVRKRTPAAAKAKAPGATITHLPEPARRKTGLEWLFSKKRITARQLHTGTSYGIDFRVMATDGVEPLRSCLNDERGGGGASGIALSYADHESAARERLHTARQALGFHADMTAACDAICGKGFTPREINPDQRTAAKIEQTLRIALDLMSQHYPLTDYLKRA